MEPEEILNELRRMKMISGHMALILAAATTYALDNWEDFVEKFPDKLTEDEAEVMRVELLLYCAEIQRAELQDQRRTQGKKGNN